jgi:hypothetical protein
LLFPRRAAVSLPDTYELNIGTSAPQSSVTIEAHQTAISHVKFVVTVQTKGPSIASEKTVDGGIDLGLPRDMQIATCKACVSQGYDQYAHAYLSLHFKVEPIRHETWTGTATFGLMGRRFPYQENGKTAEATLPAVSSSNLVNAAPAGNPSVHIKYVMAGASSYDWSGSLLPYASTTNMAEWADAAGPTPVAVRGENPSAQQSDDIRIFISGAFLGTAGGALVGAAQEVMNRRRLGTTTP